MNTLLRKALLPACILAMGPIPDPAPAQCPSAEWTLFAATGDVVEVETAGEIAWVAAKGGVIRIDVSTVSTESPDQFKITDSGGLSSTDVSSLAIDGFGNVWVGTREDGVSVFDSGGGHIENLFSFDEFIYSDKVVAIDALGQRQSDGQGGEFDRVVVSGADTYAASTGLPEGGGFKIIRITRNASGNFSFGIEPPLLGNTLDRSQELLFEPDGIWVGTGRSGLWRRDEVSGDLSRVLSVNNGGLISDNVKHLLRAPDFDGSGSVVLWIGTGQGIQTWDGATLNTLTGLAGRNILDMHALDDRLYVLTELPISLVRDLYELDLSQAVDTLRIPRADCSGDTLYVPRQVGVSDAGRIVLGTRTRAFAVREGLEWFCPPPLGPHWPRVADLELAQDGTLWFGTGDPDRFSAPNGVGFFDGTRWRALTISNSFLINDNMTEVVVWPDSTIWFGSKVDRNFGGLNNWNPRTETMRAYHPAAPLGQVTLGRSIWALEPDAQNNLWVCYGQNGGGLSVIEWPEPNRRDITDYPFSQIFTGTDLLRDIAFDSQGRVWVTTQSEGTIIGQVYVVDPNGTVADRSDDDYTSFNLANDIFDIGEVRSITIDSTDQIWLAGAKGLVVGQIADDVGGRARAVWERVRPTGTQLGGRNPLPYRVAHLDWDENIWLGTESAGLVRVSQDRVVWTWFDQLAGCPLPDQSITGFHIDNPTKTVYVGTATGGIAKIVLRETTGAGESAIEAFPNPWVPADQGPLVTFGGIPPDETTTIRIYSLAGELVHETRDARGLKTWDGTNLGGNIVETGVYVVTAVSSDGTRGKYEGKVAVVR